MVCPNQMANSKSSAGAAGVLADSVSGSKVTHIGDRERCLLKDVAGVQVGNRNLCMCEASLRV